MFLAVLFMSASLMSSAQCNMSNWTTAFKIPPASFPYTNTASITVSAVATGVPILQNFTYNCGGTPYTCSNPAWWLNSATQSIVLTFSQPVCNLTIVTNGTNLNEEFYFASNNGPISLSNFCTQGFTLINAGTALRCSQSAATGTIISISNPLGATQYTLTHSGTGSGSRITLLDCYVPCGSVTPAISCTVPSLGYCAGDTTSLSFNAIGTYNAGNVYTAQLSDALGSFVTPTIIGSILSTAASGTIPCTMPAGTPTGAGYRVRVVSSNPVVTGTDNGSNITINQYPTVTATASPNDTICAGDNLTLTGTGALTYSWTPPVIDNIPFVPASTNTYTVIGADAIGCSDTATVYVVVNPLPNISIAVSPNDSVCANEQVSLTASGAATYSWTGGITNGTPFTPPVSATYTVTGTDVNGCSNTASQLVTVKPLPIVNLGPNTQICEGDSIVLNASYANATYLWQDNSTNPTFTVKQTGNYSVTLDLDGCTASDNITIAVNPNPVIDLGPDVSYCEGASIDIGSTCPGCTYLWDDNSTQAIRTINQEGTYSVTATAANCSSSDQIFVDEIPLPLVDLGQDTTMCRGDEIFLDVTRVGGTYLWQDNSTSPTYTITDVGNYEVRVTENGCTNTDQKIITFDPDCDCPVFIPNAFSPNLDGNNDHFRLLDADFIELAYFKVYNRWGQEVFTTTDPLGKWDGNFNGEKCEIGSYYWIVGYKCLYKNTDHVQRGDVTLLR